MAKTKRTYPKVSDVFGLDGRPVSVWSELVPYVGTNAAMLFCQLGYWQIRKGLDGWVYKTAKDWYSEIKLTPRQQRLARRKLSLVIEERTDPGDTKGVHYRVATRAPIAVLAASSRYIAPEDVIEDVEEEVEAC